MKIKIVEFENGKFAAKVCGWGHAGYIDKDTHDYLWSESKYIPRECQVDTQQQACEVADGYVSYRKKKRQATKVKRWYSWP